MRALIKPALLAAGLTALLALAAPAHAADRYGRDRSGVSFSITLGDPAPRYGRYYGPRHDYWGRYPSYGYGHRRHPGYDYVRRNYYRGGHACFWDIDRQRLRGHRWALVRELNCYAPGGRIYSVPHSREVVRYIPGPPRRHHHRW